MQNLWSHILLLIIPSLFFSEKKERFMVEERSAIDFPVPNVPRLMFYIQRDPNTNTVCYTLNLKEDGSLDLEKPLNIFWIIYTDNERVKPLNYIQRVFAYGVKVKKASQQEVEFRSVAYEKLPMYLRKTKSGYKVYTTINNQKAVLNRIYVNIKGNNLIKPDVQYIQLEGTNEQGKKVTQQIRP